MCRLVGFQGSSPVDLSYAILQAPNALIRQSRCDQTACKPNEDGWGYASWAGTPKIVKEPTKAYDDGQFATLGNEWYDRVVVHVRRASVGRAKRENTHPFQLGQDLLFAHNGSIYGFEKVRDHAYTLLHPDLKEQLKGQTDSEYLMMLFATHVRTLGDWTTKDRQVFRHAVRKTVDDARRLGDLAKSDKPPKLNFMFLTKQFLIATRVIHTLGYYPNFSGGTLITSEPLDERDGWTGLDEETMLVLGPGGHYEVMSF